MYFKIVFMNLSKETARSIRRDGLISLLLYALPVAGLLVVCWLTGQRPWEQGASRPVLTFLGPVLRNLSSWGLPLLTLAVGVVEFLLGLYARRWTRNEKILDAVCFVGSKVLIRPAVVYFTLSAHSAIPWDRPFYSVRVLRPVAWVLERLISTPATHHAHHADSNDDGVGHYKGNFGNMFFLWDVLFGTGIITRRYPARYGLAHYQEEEWYAQFLWPIFKSKIAGSELARGGPMVGMPFWVRLVVWWMVGGPGWRGCGAVMGRWPILAMG